MKSIMQNDKVCYLCGRDIQYGMDALEKHHIYGGNPNRKNSEKYGLTVWLCGCSCHRLGKMAVHNNAQVMQILHEDGQRAFEKVHGSREEFMKIFGKNYL